MPTAGQWPWKPASAKECVTAHQPNGVALKMDEVQPVEPYQTGTLIKRASRSSAIMELTSRAGTLVGLKRAVDSTWTGLGSRSW